MTQNAANSTVVIGEGWSALAAVGFLVQRQKPVTWIVHSGARIFSAMPSLEMQTGEPEGKLGSGVELWRRLASGFGIELGAPATGSFLREFRGKAFREPAWTKAPTPEMRKEVRTELLWAPERVLAPLWEARFELSLNEIEHRIRTLLTGDGEEGAEWRKLIRRLEDVPVSAVKIEGERIRSVILGSGEEIAADQVLYADRWDTLPRIQGLPKNLSFIRGHEPASVLQAMFGHEPPVGAGLQEGFFGSLHKEPGDEQERHVWGHFSSDGAHSYWTLCVTGDEVEDNHQIAKRLRRLKSALDKMFTGSSWLPEGSAGLMAQVKSEAVRFHEGVIFAGSERSDKPATLPSIQGLQFVTDGFGPASALIQVARALGLEEVGLDVSELTASDLGARIEAIQSGPDSEAEHLDGESAATS